MEIIDITKPKTAKRKETCETTEMTEAKPS